MSLARSAARIVVHQTRTVCLVVAAIVVLSLLLIAFFLRLDTEILNLLPAGFDSVETLKVYNREFTPARELSFALWDENGDTDLDGFTEHFASLLKKEPWITRVLDRSPMENPDGMQDLQTFALPLLFNLPSEDFKRALVSLGPEPLRARLHRLRGEIQSGSPRAEIELGFDPLGIITPALKPLAGSFSVEQTQPLVSHDGTLHLVLAMTNQAGLGPRECQALMRQVDDLKKRVLATWTGKAPQVLVTGRTPYVAEMSKSMEHDIISTLIGSVLLVSAVFYIGFRRLRPLVAIIHVLLFCCIVSIAAGAIVFHALNGITIGFCSILVGLGVDFGMLLYGSYQAQRNAGAEHEAAVQGALEQLAKPIFFGALTTAAGFLALLFSGCAGFAQLGVLIAVGILFAALFMMTIFLALIGRQHRPLQSDWILGMIDAYARLIFRSPRAVLIASAILLVALSVFAAMPARPLRFDANPRSLEPADSRAGFALRKIQEKMSAGGIEPVLAMVQSDNAAAFHEHWSRLQAHWAELTSAGTIKNVNSPGAFALSPERVSQNAKTLSEFDLDSARAALPSAIAAEGFNIESFAGGFAVLKSLESISSGQLDLLDWKKTLPENSSWRFLLDKFFAPKPFLGAAYITPAKAVNSPAEKEKLQAQLQVAGVPIHFSGWSFMLGDLVPWSRAKLVQLSAAMIGFNIVLLILLYRRVMPLFVLMLSLAFSIGATVATAKLLQLPLNIFNVLAFPLILGVGVDYGIYLLVAFREKSGRAEGFTTIAKPVLMSGLTTVAGFGSLVFAHNPALSGLGALCAIGVGWCLFATFFFIAPAYAWKGPR